jgi:hypothetical protein
MRTLDPVESGKAKVTSSIRRGRFSQLAAIAPSAPRGTARSHRRFCRGRNDAPLAFADRQLQSRQRSCGRMGLGAPRKEREGVGAAFAKGTTKQSFPAERRAIEALGFDRGRDRSAPTAASGTVSATFFSVTSRFCTFCLNLRSSGASRMQPGPPHAWPSRRARRCGRCRVAPGVGDHEGGTPAYRKCGCAEPPRHQNCPRGFWVVYIATSDEILSRLADASADLLIMRAYGHSRMRELVLDRLTRHISGQMTAPTIWSR